MRVNAIIERGDEWTGEPTKWGWFFINRAEQFNELQRWDGNNHRGIISGLQCGHECLYRTKGGRWVRHYDATNEFNGPEFYEFITDAAAREWLLRTERDEDVEQFFGEIEDERGPGRPEIGKAASYKLGEERIARIDAARLEGESRSATIRRLLDEALQAV